MDKTWGMQAVYTGSEIWCEARGCQRDKQKAAQFRLAISISRASPASSYTYAAADLAGTGFDRQERFLTAAMAYQEELVKYFSEMSMMQQRDVKIDMDKLPVLDFREPSTSESWEMVWIDMLILFLFGACFFMIAYVGFVRSDVK